ncbi:MAG: FGGY-family carbohydrate kinase, partial [Sphaerochaetaceae bacterium]|nr:FGGY-family carbohydrate kinase [Sphaerochaetaceae bacterium]
MNITDEILKGRCSLGIEFGSTRIKTVLIKSDNSPIASSSYAWNNEIVDGYYSYSIENIFKGLSISYSRLKVEIEEKYDIKIKKLKAIGISAMMHGYMAFDEDDNLLVPFRTWRNTNTEEASKKLSELFDYSIPIRWSIAHYYQCILNGEEHVNKVKKLNTLSGYIHNKLTGNFVLGIGDASGMFPIDSSIKDYNQEFIEKFDRLSGMKTSLSEILPKVMVAGQIGGILSKNGALLIDEEGDLEDGILLCPPEGDAGTGMVSTDSVRINTGNVSAGTSVFAMIVLEKKLSKRYDKLDIVTTPDGKPVAMAHSNNCTGEYDSWISIFKEVINLTGNTISMPELYDKVLMEALKGESDCGGILSYNYLSGEPMTDLSDGRPMVCRTLNSNFNLANFMKSQLYTSLCALRIGLDILTKEENIKVKSITGHGGFFKTELVGQTVMANAVDVPINLVESSGEGGAWGIAILANYVGEEKKLEDYLDSFVFSNSKKKTVNPKKEDVDGFNKFLELY